MEGLKVCRPVEYPDKIKRYNFRNTHSAFWSTFPAVKRKALFPGRSFKKPMDKVINNAI